MPEKEEARAVARPFFEIEPFFGEWGFFPSRLASEFLGEWGWRPLRERPRAFLPALDCTEDDARYTITVELPGARREDIDVSVREGTLTVRGEKKGERDEKKERIRHVERSYGPFSRSLRLPAGADAERLEASFKEGILTITIPKTQESKPRRIAIKSG